MRSACRVIHPVTGREYLRRVQVQECYAVTVRAVLGVTSKAAADWLPLFGQVQAASDEPMPGAVRVTVTNANGGRRWLACPHCGQRCGAVYASPWDDQGKRAGPLVVGCRRCLGLTDWARQRHGCRNWAGAVLTGGLPTRASSTLDRAQAVKVAAVGVMARKAGPDWSYLAELCRSLSDSDTA